MNMMKSNILFAVFAFDSYASVPAYRCFMLGDLVTFGKIGIEIMLACEIIGSLNFTMAGKAHAYCIFNGFLIKFRKCTWQRKCDCTDVGVGLSPISCAVS